MYFWLLGNTSEGLEGFWIHSLSFSKIIAATL